MLMNVLHDVEQDRFYEWMDKHNDRVKEVSGTDSFIIITYDNSRKSNEFEEIKYQTFVFMGSMQKFELLPYKAKQIHIEKKIDQLKKEFQSWSSNHS